MRPAAADFNYGTAVTLTATGGAGWTFTGWQGALSGAANPQAVTVDANKTVTATSGRYLCRRLRVRQSVRMVSATTDFGNLSVSSAAAMVGTRGMQALINDNNSLYVTDNTPNAEPHYRSRFNFDPNSIQMSIGNAHYIFYAYSGASTVVLRIEFRCSSPNRQLLAELLNNGITWTSSSWFTISDGPHVIETDWQAATAAGANNGYLTLWIDGVQRANLTGVANDTRRIDSVRLGAVSGIDTGTRGTYYFDTCRIANATKLQLLRNRELLNPQKLPISNRSRETRG